MNWSTLFLITQILLALATGAYAAFRLQDVIRSLVVRSMPVEKRISDESFDIQTRKSTIIAFILFFFVAGLVYWGISLGEDAIWPKVQQHEEQSFFSPSHLIPKKEGNKIEKPIDKPLLEKAPIVLDTVSSTVIKQTPKAYEQPQPMGPYYLQLGAYNSAKAALDEACQFQISLQESVQVVVIPHTKGPNKVLIGAFSSRKAVNHYRQGKNLVGFARKMD